MKKKLVLRHCDLDLWPKVTKFNRVRAGAISNHLAKTASKSVHPFGLNFVHKKCRTDTHTHTHTHTQTHWSENITPPRFRGGLISWMKKYKPWYLANLQRCSKFLFQFHIWFQEFLERHFPYSFFVVCRNENNYIGAYK